MKKRHIRKDDDPSSPLFPAESAGRDKSNASPPDILPLKPTPVYDTYWRFAAERQRIFFRRLEGLPAPWTQDVAILFGTTIALRSEAWDVDASGHRWALTEGRRGGPVGGAITLSRSVKGATSGCRCSR